MKFMNIKLASAKNKKVMYLVKASMHKLNNTKSKNKIELINIYYLTLAPNNLSCIIRTSLHHGVIVTKAPYSGDTTTLQHCIKYITKMCFYADTRFLV